MAGIADDLVAKPGDDAFLRGGPPSLGRSSDHDHRAAVVGIPFLHRLECRQHLVVVVAVVETQHVPAVGRPLVGDLVAFHGLRHHPADQRVVDAGVVERQQDAQTLAHLLCDGLGLQLLGVAGSHGEFAFDPDDLG